MVAVKLRITFERNTMQEEYMNTEICFDGLLRYYERKIVPFLSMFYFSIIGLIIYVAIRFGSLGEEGYRFMAIAIVMLFFLFVLIRNAIFNVFFEYKTIDHDEKSMTLTNRKNVLNKKIWKYTIDYKVIAQVRVQRGQPYKIILNDGSVFTLPPHNSVVFEGEGGNYFDIFGKIHTFFLEELNMSIPLCLPKTHFKRGTTKSDIHEANKIVVARTDNFEEINSKVKWPGIINDSPKGTSESRISDLPGLAFGGLLGVSLALFSLIGIWCWILITEKSFGEANSYLASGGRFFTGLTFSFAVFAFLYLFLAKIYDKKDLEVGEQINERYLAECRKISDQDSETKPKTAQDPNQIETYKSNEHENHHHHPNQESPP